MRRKVIVNGFDKDWESIGVRKPKRAAGVVRGSALDAARALFSKGN